MTYSIDIDMFNVMVCPKSGNPLKLTGNFLTSTDSETRLQYEIKNGIPIMLIDKAKELPLDIWQKIIDGEGPVSGENNNF